MRNGEHPYSVRVSAVFRKMSDYPYDDYGFEKFETNEFPLAFLITFRTFGTWLHGDDRKSVDRHGKNTYGTKRIEPDRKLNKAMKDLMKQPDLTLDDRERSLVEAAIKEYCRKRGYGLLAINVRSNHVHAVVSARVRPERLADSFKAAATKKLREENLVSDRVKVWSRGRSRRYLWKPHHVKQAIDYVLYSQGDEDFDIQE